MKKHLICFVVLFLVCVLMPSGATAAFSISIYGSPRNGEPGDSFTFNVSVQPISEDGSSGEGQTVTFSVSPDDGTVSLSTTSATTDSNGQAQTTLRTGSGSSGSYTVTASHGTLSVSNTATVNTPAPTVLSISVIVGPGSGDPGDALTFTVEVQEDGSAASGKTVTFSITSGDGNASLNPTSATTGSNGRASTSVTLRDSASGSYTVTATVGSKSTSGTATVNTPAPTVLSISVVSGPGSGDPGDALTFTVEVQEDGSAASGKTVTFSITSGDGNASLNPTSATTGSNGRASTSVTLGDSASGSYTVTATVGSKSTSGTATVESSPLPPSPSPELSISVVSGPGSGEPGDALTFTVEVQEDGSAASGKTVTFSITSGDGNASLNPTSATTGSNGRASTSVTLGDSASGSYTVTATVGSKSTSGTATVESSPLPPSPSPELSISVVSGPGSGEPGDSLTFTVEVQEDGSPVSGKAVRFSITTGDGNASLGPSSTLTDSNGRAQTALTLGNSASGSYTITATITTLVGEQSVSGTATVESSSPPSHTIVLYISNSAPLQPGDSVTFTAEVKEGGNRASGQTVTFSMSPDDGTATLSTASATTDSNGEARTTLTLGSSASGSYTVTATLDNGQSASNSTWRVGSSVGGFVMELYNSSLPINPGESMTFDVRLYYREDGSLASGQTVTFGVSPDDGTVSLTTTSATTGSNGRASTKLITGSNSSGSYTVTATRSDGDSLSGTATVVTSTSPPEPEPEFSIIVIAGPGGPVMPGVTSVFLVDVVADNGLPQGQTVTFSVSPDDGTVSLSPLSATTSEFGLAQTTVTIGSDASGSYTVTAILNNGLTVSETMTVEAASPPPLRTLVMFSDNLHFSQPGDSVTFTAEVGEGGSPVQNQTVTFSVNPDNGTASLNPTNATTDSGGRTQTTLTLGSDASGSYTITASVNLLSVSSTVTVETVTVETPTSQQQEQQQLDVAIGSLPTPQGTSVSVGVSQNRNPVAGQTVTFSVSPDDGTASLSTTSTTTDGDGQASTTLITGSNSARSYTVIATLNDGQSTSWTATVKTSSDESSPEDTSQGGGLSPQQQQQPSTMPPPRPMQTTLEGVSSDNQSGLTGETLATPFVVEVRDQYDDPMAGVTVTFSLLTGGGALSATTATTDANGRAESTLTLGSDPGTNSVKASVDGISRTEVFSAEASLPPPVPTTLSIVSGENQNGLTGEALANPFVVEVRDQYDAPIAGVTVTFAVSEGGGALSATTATTDANGRAESTLTLGSDPGTTSVEASVEGISRTEVFSAEASLPPPVATSLSIVSGDNQEAVIGEVLTNSFVVEVHDQYDDPMAGVTVTFAVSAGGGSLSSEIVMTNANGQAESTLTLGSEPGTNSVEVSVEGISRTEVFSAEASLPPPVPTALSIVSGDNREGLTGEVLANPFVVEVRDQYDDPMDGIAVTFAVTAGGGSLSATTGMTDANGRAESTLTLGSDPGANTVEVSVEGITEATIFNAIAELLEFDLSVPSGISFVHVPLKIASVDGRAQALESVGDLYDALGGAATVKLLITYNRDTLQWNSYLGDESRGDPEDRVLTDDLGIIASMKTPVSVRLGGEALGVDGMSIISLNRGMNLVGLPLKDLRITRVSDLLALEGIAGVVSSIIVSDERRFKTVGRVGDDGDIPVTGGQSFFLIAAEAATVDISGEAWTNSPVMLTAPPIARAGVETGDTTPVLALTGSISTDGTGLNKTGVHVTVKNLTTGKSVTTAVINRGYRDLDYQATTVDMGTGQAARIGDVLEISAQSPELSIRFHPVRHIVTSEDVERSRIHLPELIAYEIPAKTELLSNYPNPFNPETWIPYGLANDTNVQISIYDISGALVRQLNLGHQRAGNYTQRSRAAYWDGRNGVGEHVASGVYFYTLTADDFTATRKMLVGK